MMSPVDTVGTVDTVDSVGMGGASGASGLAGMTNSTRANDAWQALLTAHAVVMRQLGSSDVWREASMREYDVLYTLAQRPAPASQSELERHVLLSQPAISRLVDRLVTRGLVDRVADPADGRRVLLALTEAGRGVQRRIGARHARDVARLMSERLNRDELTALARLGRALSDG